MDTTPAILVRKVRLTETSLIVTWLSEEHGRIKTVAKGARAQKSRFSGLLDLFFCCDIQYERSRKSDLHALREVALRNPYPGLRSEYPRLMLAGYFVELLELVMEPEHPSPDLYDLLQRALTYLNDTPASRRALEHFESELCRLLGIHQPNLTGAISLARTYHSLPASRQAFVQLLG